MRASLLAFVLIAITVGAAAAARDERTAAALLRTRRAFGIGSGFEKLALTGSSGGLPIGTGVWGFRCTDSNPCDTGYKCTLGVCLPTASAPCSQTCADNFQCSYGLCVPTFSATCSPACGTGAVCALGTCITPTSGALTCDPACDDGSLCIPGDHCINTNVSLCSVCSEPFVCTAGVCVPPFTSPSLPSLPALCSPACGLLQVCAPDASALSAGENPLTDPSALSSLSFKCVTLPSLSDLSSTPSVPTLPTCNPACTANTQTCLLGQCLPVPTFSISDDGDVKTITVEAIVRVAISIPDLPIPTPADVSAAILSVAGQTFQQLESQATATYEKIQMGVEAAEGAGQAAAGAAQQAVLQLKTQAQATADQLETYLKNGAIVLEEGAQFTANAVKVAANSTLSAAFSALTKGATDAAGVIAFGEMALEEGASMIVDGLGRLQFPLDPNLMNVSSLASLIEFSGNTSVSGSSGTASIYIGNGMGSVAAITVGPGFAFSMSGNVLGSSLSVMQVDGSFSFAGSLIAPLLNVTGTGSFDFNGTAMTTGNVSLGDGSTFGIHTDGRAVQLGVLSCATGAQIIYYAPGKFSDGSATSGTIAFYSPGSSALSGCKVKVIDLDGAEADLTPIVAATGATGEAPSSGSSSGSGNAVFGANSLTYTGAQPNGAATLAPTAALALVLAGAAAFFASKNAL